MNPFSLAGKRALITGGGTGIGLGISKAMIEAGAKVIITGRREEVLKAAVAVLGPQAHYVVHDITHRDSIPTLVNNIDPLDILVNNAGIHLKKEVLDTSDEEFENIIQTNLISVFALSRECARGMIQRKSGSIILIGSMAGNFGVNKVVAYGTSKGALKALMNNMVTEFSQHNVRVNTIAPGWIESDMFLNAINADPERKQKIVNRVAMPFFGKPEDIGNAAVYLSSEAGRYVTGVTLNVDGGATVNF